eukprot:TRINITY_DN1415_c0_g1_i1.p1 TRINITY_DN1415_c0_g1~~TRINITY_DN1415_c0_g1_i1.p1  ORF type:complete len:950 (+),score=168.14 TRINITY_DN1415_c0_g1_i1:298-3147(+)
MDSIFGCNPRVWSSNTSARFSRLEEPFCKDEANFMGFSSYKSTRTTTVKRHFLCCNNPECHFSNICSCYNRRTRRPISRNAHFKVYSNTFHNVSGHLKTSGISKKSDKASFHSYRGTQGLASCCANKTSSANPRKPQRGAKGFARSGNGDSKDKESSIADGDESKYSYYVESVIDDLRNLPARASVTRGLEHYKSKLTLNDFAVIFRELGGCGEWQRCLKLFRYMQRQQWCKPNENIYTLMIGILGREGLLDRCAEIFEEMPEDGIRWSVYSFTALINAYGRNGQYETCLHLLARMKREGIAPALITYNTVINACVKGGLDWEGLLGLFAQMRHEGIQPDMITYNALLSACSSRGLPNEAEMVFRAMNEVGIVPNTTTYSLLVQTFKNIGELDRVSKLYKEMELAGSLPDVTAYNLLLEALSEAQMFKEVDAIFRQMKEAGCSPTVSTYVILINSYGHDRQFNIVRKLFNEMKATDIELDAVAYNTLIDVFGKGGYYEDVMSFFHDMVESSVQPALETYEGLMFACGAGGLLEDAKKVFKYMQDKEIVPTVKVLNGLIQAYGKSALYEDAVVTLYGMRDFEREPDRCSYNSLICMYGRGGLFLESLRMFCHMKEADIKTNIDTFNGVIESLSRAGEYKEAEGIYKDVIASEYSPNKQTYEILLNMYCTAGSVEKARLKFCEFKEQFSTPTIAAYCLMISMYAKRNRWEDVCKYLGEIQASDMPDIHLAVASLLLGDPTESDWQCAINMLERLKTEGVDMEMTFYNALLDALWWLGQKATATRVLQETRIRCIFPEAFRRTNLIWSVDLHRMSIGAALTAVSTWLLDMHRSVMDTGNLSKLSSIVVVRGKAEQRPQAKHYPISKAVHQFLKDFDSPFRYAEWNNGRIVCQQTQLKRWLSTEFQPESTSLRNSPLPFSYAEFNNSVIKEDINGRLANFKPEENIEIELASV